MSKSLFDIGAVKFEYSKPNLTLPSPERRGCPFPFQGKAGDEVFQVLEGTAPVKLSAIYCLKTFLPFWLEHILKKKGISQPKKIHQKNGISLTSRIHPKTNPSDLSHLFYAVQKYAQYKVIVKLHRVFSSNCT